MITFLRFDAARARLVVPAFSDAALPQALTDVCRTSEDVLPGRHALAEAAEEQLRGIALAMCRGGTPEMAVTVEERLHDVLAAHGRDVVDALGERGIAVRPGDDGRLWAGPAERIDEADRELLTAHRDEVLSALRAASPVDLEAVPDGTAPGCALSGESLRAIHIRTPGSDARFLDEVAAVLVRHPGPDEVLLHLEVDGSEVVVQAGERFRVVAGLALQADLEACFERWVEELNACTLAAAIVIPVTLPRIGS